MSPRPAPHPLLPALAQALARRDLAQARALHEQLGRDAPGLPEARLAGAMLARLEGRADEALAMLDALHAQHPGPPVDLERGQVLAAQGRPREAEASFRAVLRAAPRHAEASLHLARLLAARAADAGPLFLHAARHAPRLAAAYRGALLAAAALARNAPPPAAPTSPFPPRYSLSVVCCSIRPERLARLRANLRRQLAAQAWELIHIPDARSLAEGYNRGLARARGEFVLFCHDDIRVLAPDFDARLYAHLQRYDLIGAAGTTRLTGPGLLWSGPPHGHGWIAYPDERGRPRPSLSSTRGPVVEDAQALDGMFLAGRRAFFARLGFDARTFDGFDHYDLDLSRRAWRGGARIAVCQDLLVEHASLGGFGPRWAAYAQRFVHKFPELGREPAYPGPSIFLGDAADSDDHLRATYAWLGHWIAALDASGGVAPC